MNLHDWIDELCDVLDVETEVDEASGPRPGRGRRRTTSSPRPLRSPTYLLGCRRRRARSADPEAVETLAAQAQPLAEGWDRPANAPDPDDIDDDVPDDSAVDHSGDESRRTG